MDWDSAEANIYPDEQPFPAGGVRASDLQRSEVLSKVERHTFIVHWCQMTRINLAEPILGQSDTPFQRINDVPLELPVNVVWGYPKASPKGFDVYFSADVETDGPIPGPFSMLSFGLVYAGAYDGTTFYRPPEYRDKFYIELRPISDAFEREALDVNGLDRDALMQLGKDPALAMTQAAAWVLDKAGAGTPIIVAYPLSFDWMWLYWYFVKYSTTGSPFGHSRGFDIKTAISIKLGRMVSKSGRSRIPESVKSRSPHTHNAIDDAIEQADIFANVFTMREEHG